MVTSSVTESLIAVDAEPGIVSRPEVLEEIAKVADETVKYMSDYVQTQLEQRFPNGLSQEIAEILGDIIIDSFHDGARWAEKQRVEESRIILT
jgi:hypothetical protein